MYNEIINLYLLMVGEAEQRWKESRRRFARFWTKLDILICPLEQTGILIPAMLLDTFEIEWHILILTPGYKKRGHKETLRGGSASQK